MRSPDRATVCVSSQAGCAMGCTFCATGQAGFERHLDGGEIVEQVVRAAARHRRSASRTSCSWAWASRSPTSTPCCDALERLHDDFGLSARHLTVSTVGVVPGMRRLAQHPLPGDARGLAARARRRAPRDARAAQPPLPDRGGARRGPRLRGDQGPAGHVRVRVHRGRERPPAPGRPPRRAAHRACAAART